MIATAISSDSLPLGSYGEHQYFAFIESIDDFDIVKTLPDWMPLLLQSRDRSGLPPPTRIVWLDCVRAAYFAELPWRDQECSIGDADQSRTRRQQISELEENQLRIVLLLLSDKDESERGTIAQLTNFAWHRVTIDEKGGTPSFVASEFDFDAADRILMSLQYVARCSEGERNALARVFNLNFLPDANDDDLGRPNPQDPPMTPVDKGRGRERQFEVAQVEAVQEQLRFIDRYERNG